MRKLFVAATALLLVACGATVAGEETQTGAQGTWELSEAGAGEALTLAAVEGVQLDVDTIYRDPLTAG